MIKVLQIMDGKIFGGITKLMLDISKNIDKNIKFEFLTANNICDEFYNLGINRETLKGRITYNYRLYKFLKKNKYDIVHINSGAFFFTFFCAITCKISGIKKIVVHSHNTPQINFTKKILIKLLNPIYRKITNAHLSCSKEAIKSLFTKEKNIIILKNGIDINKFKYNETIRNKHRKKLELSNKIVYGHVGGFEKQKNHEFLIDLFYELQKKQDCILLLIGIGELENTIRKKTKKLNIQNKVIFLGFRNDVNELLNSMDIFLFPSLYEGFGNVVIEAQTNGLPTFVSPGVPEDSNISNNYHKIKNYNINDWVNEIIKVKHYDRKNSYKDIIKAGYDIKDTSKELEKIYIDLMKK